MKKFLESQLEEIRENKLRISSLIVCLIGAIIFAVYDSWESGEEINLDAPQNVAQVERPVKDISETNKKITVSSEKVKAVIGANADEVFIYDPFKNPTPPVKVEEVPVKVEEKILPPTPPTESVNIMLPVVEVPKPPEDNFFLRGTALADNKTALIEKISNGKTETLFLQIGDKLNDKIIVDIATDFVTLDDGSNLYIE